MDAHPIPQNVTNFEFHLIGDMTLKQFGYLATGLGISYVIFLTSFTTYPIIAVPIIILASLTGAAFAFVPIADRPLDHWLMAYFKAVFSPTKRTFRASKTVDPKNPLLFNRRLQLYLQATSQQTPQQISPRKPVLQVSRALTPTPPQTTHAVPSDSQLQKTVELGQQSQAVQQQIADYEKKLHQIKESQVAPHDVKQIFDNLQGLISKAQNLSAQLDDLQPSSPHPQEMKKAEVKVVETTKAQPTQLNLTSSPNIINGIVTDSSGNYLENVVVVIHNKEGLPVRASKTNKLGQFAGATPLPSGEYTLTLEKEALEFDTIQISLKGEVLPPIQINSKKGGV